MALRQADGTVTRNPNSGIVLTSGDTIFVLGHADHLLAVARRTVSRIVFRGARA